MQRPRGSRDSMARDSMAYDSFRPKLPLDPFADAFSPLAPLRAPWSLPFDIPPVTTTLSSQRNVVLILGEPPLEALQPLYDCSALASSLLIFVTHAPLQPPSLFHPYIRVLRLSDRLAVEDTGAAQFVNILEWAERVARVWRKRGGDRYQELLASDDPALATDMAALVPPSRLRFGASRSTPSSPQASQTDFGPIAPPTPPSLTPSSSQQSLSRLRKIKPILPPSDPTQRPFDAILNFMPADLPHKALLKQAILVTTISRPFLVALQVASSKASSLRSRTASAESSPRLRRNSFFRLSSALSRPTPDFTFDVVPTPPNEPASCASSFILNQENSNARIAHILPAPQRQLTVEEGRLIRSIEAFLLSFSFSMPEQANGVTPARPYLLHSSTFAETLRYAESDESEDDDEPSVWAVSQIILSGALETDCGSSLEKGKGKDWTSRRAYLSGASDIVVIRDNLECPDAAAASGIVGSPASSLVPLDSAEPVKPPAAVTSMTLSKARPKTTQPFLPSPPTQGISLPSRTSRLSQPPLPTPPDSSDSSTESESGPLPRVDSQSFDLPAPPPVVPPKPNVLVKAHSDNPPISQLVQKKRKFFSWKPWKR